MISFIIPLYNKAPYIEATLDSVSRQSVDDYEVLVVDDGSTDDGPERVRSRNDPRVHLHQQPNAGPAAARNYGISLARGDWVCFLDADDQLDPAFLERHLAWQRRFPECVMTVSGFTRGPERLSNEGEMRDRGFTPGPWTVTQANRPGEDVFFLAGWVCHSGAIVARKSAIDQAGGFYPKGKCLFGEDHCLWLILLLCHPVCLMLEPLMWINTDASSLGPAQQGAYPPRPILSDPDWILDRVPREHHRLVRSVRAHHAVLHGRQCVDQQNYMAALTYFRMGLAHPGHWAKVMRETARLVIRSLGWQGRSPTSKT